MYTFIYNGTTYNRVIGNMPGNDDGGKVKGKKIRLASGTLYSIFLLLIIII